MAMPSENCAKSDASGVFELGYSFTAKMPVLLTEPPKNNIGLFYDDEANKQLDEYETNAVIKEMIFYFENCDEGHVYQRLHKKRYCEDGEYDPEKRKTVRAELERCRTEVPRLFFQVALPSLVLTCNINKK